MPEAPKQISVNSLSPQELSQLSENLQSEIQTLTSHFNALRGARERYLESRRVLNQLSECKPGDPLLVPLSSSLYVPGVVGDNSKAIIEVGTGYFIKMPVPKGQDFMDRKVKNLQETMQEAEKAVNVKQQQLDIMQMTLRSKIMQAQQAQAEAEKGKK
eukprot:TRINITY_DN39188_c0_g1_i1.p1 TRINITY_DN39188_c0_g1~~TRINITY_DN39188_c0_g1_i1.p1  ORF type:complete len:158 (+),score=62.85 TRINITY_DN39188_c0_g1_i1:67-540(+)